MMFYNTSLYCLQKPNIIENRQTDRQLLTWELILSIMYLLCVCRPFHYCQYFLIIILFNGPAFIMIISRIEKIIWLNVWRVISTTNLLCDLNEELVDFIRDADLRLTLYFHDTGVLLTGRVRPSWNVPKPVIPWIINAQHLGPSNKPVNINLIALNPPSSSARL